jgi:hypothetical protein
MPSIRSALAALLCFVASALPGQQASTTDADSARRIVQRFYDWYVPRAAKPGGRDVVMQAAAHGPLPFAPELVRWLRIDSTARAKTPNEINGLDGDPYLNAQDPCDAYSARSVNASGKAFLVNVVGHGGCPAHSTPDIVVEIGRVDGRWTMLEFRDPHRRNEGIIPLLKRLHPKAVK